MAYPQATFLHHVMKWRLNGTDTAEMTSNWYPSDPNSDPAADALRLSSRSSILWAALAPSYGVNTVYQGTSSYLMPLSGPAQAVYHYPATPVPGTSGSAAIPQEVAICVSTQALGAGVGSRGRMYLPAPVINQLNTQGKMPSGFVTTVINAMQDFMEPMLLPITRSGLWSRKNSSVTQLVSIRIGDVYDVQRRRRNDTPEVYQVANL